MNHRWFDSTPEVYHADPADSFSTLRDCDRNPELYYLRRVRRVLPSETSDALEFGSAFHCAVLEPQRFAAEYVTAPKFDRRTKAGKEGYAAWEAEHAGKKPLDKADADLICRMAEKVDDNPWARDLVGEALHVERGIKWECSETGLPLRARPDAIGSKWVVNLKTAQSADPQEFTRAIARHKYHAQAAMDLEAAAPWMAMDAQHYLLVVEKQPPWECCVYRLGSDALEAGRLWLGRVRRELRARREFDSWKSPRWNTVTTLTLPKWELQELFVDE